MVPSAGQSEVDVLVAGAGPTGQTLALELARHGVRCRLVDQSPERSDKTRALVVQARSLELLQRHGLAAPLVEAGRRAMDIQAFIQRRPRFEARLDDIGAEDTPYPFLLFISQAETERILDEGLARASVRVERPWTLTDAHADRERVLATLRAADGREEQVSCRYLVGCDGAHSVVRKLAGLRFEGAAYPQDFLLADVDVAWNLPPGRLVFFLADEGLLAAFPFKAPGQYRLLASRRNEGASGADPTLADFQMLLARMCPTPVQLTNPRWLARFRLHHRGVDRYRSGRIFVAGDAAHIHSPAGGQGMNTGIQDAVNLGWKLAHVLQGRANDVFLDSYNAERFPVGKRLLQVTDRLFAFMASRSRALNVVRNLVAPLVVPWVLDSRERRLSAFRFVSQLAIRYRKSPIVEEPVGGDSAFAAGPHAGDRAPDAPLLDAAGRSTSVFELCAKPRHHLLRFGDPSGELATLPAWIETHGIAGRFGELADPSGVARRRYGIQDRGLVLVRPDWHIAFRSPTTELGPVGEFLRTRYRVTG